ncbi:DUF4003 domain-containing protein [Mobilitalea sibirica]|uniref:DUF4003 domain-containing protein n=1 Tax=Mobilitalea sibirica TaxID=1462919 RepID=A0A8J7KU64_9FIRM|nr:DUF4003 family protein [Mobilitalea sibirica]MBH1942126.1 DUF4003 domain-containing protein [Mobilitalea sibirica]
MKGSLKNKCDLFAENYKQLYKSFKWNYTSSVRLGALLYTMSESKLEIDRIKECKSFIKNKTGVFSQFKDTTNFITSVMLSLQENPAKLIEEAIIIYKDMKKEGFHSSPYLVLAALSIAMEAEDYQYNNIIKSAKSFYDAMKKEHRFITSSDDYGFATLLAMSDISINQAIREMENCYRILKEHFSYSNSVQALSHVLTFSEEDAAVKCRRTVELNNALHARKCKFGSGMQISFLGVVALLSEETGKLADEIAATNQYLKSKKGFGGWSISAKERLMYATALVCDDYLADQKHSTMEMTLANNITNILLAQQMAMIAATSAGAAAAAGSS